MAPLHTAEGIKKPKKAPGNAVQEKPASRTPVVRASGLTEPGSHAAPHLQSFDKEFSEMRRSFLELEREVRSSLVSSLLSTLAPKEDQGTGLILGL